MNNPVRAWVQRHYEARLLEELGGTLEEKRVMEIGCGRGVGIEILLARFGARQVVAFDADPAMVALARRRITGNRADLAVADAAAVPAGDGAFDAVVDFGSIHHVSDWRSAVAEVGRVLRPGGRFYFEEATSRALGRWVYRTFLDHPQDRFSAEQFVGELGRHGISVPRTVEWFFGDFIIGVGVRR